MKIIFVNQIILRFYTLGIYLRQLFEVSSLETAIYCYQKVIRCYILTTIEMTHDVYTKLYKSLVEPVLYYGPGL